MEHKGPSSHGIFGRVGTIRRGPHEKGDISRVGAIVRLSQTVMKGITCRNGQWTQWARCEEMGASQSLLEEDASTHCTTHGEDPKETGSPSNLEVESLLQTHVATTQLPIPQAMHRQNKTIAQHPFQSTPEAVRNRNHQRGTGLRGIGC